ISDGCLNRCAYCAIPLIRGNLKSREMLDILTEVKTYVEQGVYEINLISQDTTRYGYDLYKKNSLIDLLKQIITLKGKFKIRLLYLYPDQIDLELINFIKDNQNIVLPYFDIPIQHSEDKILTKMFRKGDKKHLQYIMKTIRELIPHSIIRTTIIVGFPYETKDDVNNLIEFMKEVKFDRLGCFTYSKEEGTHALTYPDTISESEKLERYNLVMSTQQQISYELNKAKVGKVYEAVIEEYSEEDFMYIARSYEFSPDDIDGFIYVASLRELKAGDVVKVKILDFDNYTLTGQEEV
ncbi:MAG: MiaB/RimO family radical SAM methylthiotransferase, partial [Anaeroplasmataceae bacterium]